MMKKITTCILFAFITIGSYSQYIEGRIFDADTNKPIEGVHVYIDGVEDGALSNSKGVFYLKFLSSSVEFANIHFSHIEYKNTEVPFNKKQKEYNVYLNKEVTLLGEVSIVEKRNLKQTISYKKLKSMKSGLFSFGAVLNKDKIYIVGGDASLIIDGAKRVLDKYADANTELSIIEIIQRGNIRSYSIDSYKGDFLTYDIPTDTWVHNDVEFEKRAYHNANLFGDNLYVLGGTTLSGSTKKSFLNTDIEIINLQTNTKIVDGTNPHQAVNFASFNYQGNLIVAGGSVKTKRNETKEYTNKVHFYDLKEGYWYELDTMPKGKETNGVLIDDKIYLIGGFNRKPLSEIESYDLITKQWKKEGDLFFGIESPAVAHNNEIIYIFDKGKIYTYNTTNKEINEFYINLSLTYSKMYFSNNKIYILGGINEGEYDTIPSSSLYSIDISEFNKTQIRRTKTL